MEETILNGHAWRNLRWSALLPYVCFLLVANDATAQSLAERIKPLIEAHQGTLAVAIKHLERSEAFAYRADQPMPTASLIKLAVMVEAYRQAEAQANDGKTTDAKPSGRIDLAKMMTLGDKDKVPGSGILTPHFSAGMQLSIRDAIRLMIVYSDNTATNLVLEQIGLKSTAETMERLGLPNTKIHAKVYRGDTSIFPERSRQFGLGSTTADEMVRLLEMIHTKKVVSAGACDAMLDHLLACDDRTMLAALLPPGTKIAHKTGAVGAVRTEAAIIFSSGGPIAVCVLTSENRDQRWTDDNAAKVLGAKIARAAYDYFSAAKANGGTANGAKPAGDAVKSAALRNGDNGPLVVDLQRTLNARLNPSPDLSLDGDFGPATETAVKRLQQAKKLAVTGSVDAATWQALGPLVVRDEAVPEPAAVNGERLMKRPDGDLNGPPLVTAKAWAIADAASGKVLWGEQADRPREIASTTKIMTAYVVLRLAAADAKVMDEVVTMSQPADNTPGSTSDVRAGEQLPVAEALYGLMLPSGNDMAVALAEHFGPRFAAEGDAKGGGGASSKANVDSVARFVAEMNRAAKALAMERTTFKNPHGLSAEGHLSSASDLARLSAAALGVPRFRDYISARQRGCTVTGPGGYRRNVFWKNTNHLLAVEGYDGIKTGTTGAAGACLVSLAKRGERERITVVLGSTSSDGRYVDTRNLLRWSWGERDPAEGKR